MDVLQTPQVTLTHDSAAGILALLEDDDLDLQRFCLQQLYQMVDVFWSEISDEVGALEALSEDEEFPDRELAAAVASKCYYHLEVYDEALRLALVAGKYFDLNEESEYTQQIVSRCIDEYVAQKKAEVQGAKKSGDGDDDDADGDITATAADAEDDDADAESTGPREVDPAVQEIVERMYQKCYAAGHFRQALGVAFEAHDLPKIEVTLALSLEGPALVAREMLGFCFKLCQTSDMTRAFRTAVLRILAAKYRALHDPDYINVCQCLQYLNDAQVCDALLVSLCCCCFVVRCDCL